MINILLPTDNVSKWRDILRGGEFLKSRLVKFSKRETDTEYTDRKKITYCPNYARSGLFEVRNTICRRFSDIKRNGGGPKFTEILNGKHGGVDLHGSSMSSFIGKDVLTELLFMQCVGVYIDNMPAPELKVQNNDHPYLYLYKREDINKIKFSRGKITELTLTIYPERSESSEPKKVDDGFQREFKLLADGVSVIDHKNDEQVERFLDLDEIPFVFFELTHPLLEDVADAQIALMNMNSADLIFGIKANFPFYVENSNPDPTDLMKQYGLDADGNIENTPTSKDQELNLGVTKGKRYPIGANAPTFIAPPAEPLEASMKKQKEIKADIRHMLNLSLSLLADRRSSADSKMVDDRSTEAGVRTIAAELQKGEEAIIRIWHKYIGVENTVTVTYPSDFELRSEVERNEEAKKLLETMKLVHTQKARKELLKEVYRLLFASKIPESKLEEILREVDRLKYLPADHKELRLDVDSELISRVDAAQALQYPSGTVAEALEEKKERATAVAMAQAQVDKLTQPVNPDNPEDRNLNNNKEQKKQSRDNTLNTDTKDRTRGEQK